MIQAIFHLNCGYELDYHETHHAVLPSHSISFPKKGSLAEHNRSIYSPRFARPLPMLLVEELLPNEVVGFGTINWGSAKSAGPIAYGFHHSFSAGLWCRASGGLFK